MNLKAVIKAGLINGLAAGLALHWLLLALLYELVVEFEWPTMIGTPVSALAVIVLLIALLSIGPYAVFLSKENVKTSKQGFLVGAGAGMVVGLMVYLAVGALGNTLVLGTIPLTSYLAEPDQLNGIQADEVLKPVVRSAMAGTYLVIAAHLLLGALIGGIEGLVFIAIRAWRPGRRTGSAKSETSANDL
jgi:hypothetical protein